jgi:nicotinate-nucleotide pyrophosphorylase (carboxylating)
VHLSLHDRAFIAAALAEDVGTGDLSSSLFPDGKVASFAIVARESLVACGLPLVRHVLELLAEKERIVLRPGVKEGGEAKAGEALLRGSAPARAVLTGERTILNFVRQLCAVATLARRMSVELQGTGARLLDTRKTLPGMRGMQKYAARVGGARNHRFGLFDGIMLKDNHIALYGGSIAKAVEAAREAAPLLTKIEVECDTLVQVRECLYEAAPDVVLLDNMAPSLMREAVVLRKASGRFIPFEASGNVTPERLKEIAATGVEYISAGCLTYSPPPVDIGLDIVAG